MAISTNLQYAKLNDLYIDPMNPRLGRNNTGRHVSQDKVLDLMRDWRLDELAISFLKGGGFWTHEALLVTKENLYGQERLVVIEGNRRLAALKYLHNAIGGKPVSQKWKEIAESARIPDKLFAMIPFLEVGSRREIEAFLGFRHVTGIKEWKPTEKAEYIAKMIDERQMTYDEVTQKIGSKIHTVRQNYVSYRLLLQIENSVEDFPLEKIGERFSVMYLSLRTLGVQQYLQIDIKADPEALKTPVPDTHVKALANFAFWLFGDKTKPPLFTDSRQVDNFGRILESNDAVQYLERTEIPIFEYALRMAGADEPEIIRLVERAADNIEQALGRAHFFTKSKNLQIAVERLNADVKQLISIFSTAGNKSLDEDR